MASTVHFSLVLTLLLVVCVISAPVAAADESDESDSEDESDESDAEVKKEALKKEVAKLRQENVGLRQENVRLRQENVESREENVRLRQDNVGLIQENVGLKQENERLRQENVGSRQENVGLKQENVRLRQENVELKVQVSELQIIVNSSRAISEQVTCKRGMYDTKSRSKILLWGKVLTLCDTETDGGDWIVIQRRTKGDVDFYRGWEEYKNGFGNPDTDFWIGNDVIHKLTSEGYTELRVDLKHKGRQYFAHYTHFYVANETSLYRLSVTGYSGTAGDSLAHHNEHRLRTPEIEMAFTAHFSLVLTLLLVVCLISVNVAAVEEGDKSVAAMDESNLSNAEMDKEVFEKEVAKLRQENEELKNENVELKQENVELKQENVDLKVEVSELQTKVNASRAISEITCKRGMYDINSRAKILLWGKVLTLCDTETDGGGWIVIQRRTKGDVNFYRGWKEYKKGFGTPVTDFWIGNDVIHNLTSDGYTELRVDLEYQGKQYFAHYSHFDVADEASLYRLSVSGYTGTAGKICSIITVITFLLLITTTTAPVSTTVLLSITVPGGTIPMFAINQI